MEKIVNFLTVDEAAAEIRSCRNTVYAAVARGEIPSVRIGRKILIPAAWVRQKAAVPDASASDEGATL